MFGLHKKIEKDKEKIDLDRENSENTISDDNCKYCGEHFTDCQCED